MNTDRACGPIPMETWERSEMRLALSQRDVGLVYRLLGAAGISQRQIAHLTEQHQSEVSSIAQGRHVAAYDVLARIADGLGVPRGYMGLAYSGLAIEQQVLESGVAAEGDSAMDRRKFLGAISKLAVGAALTPAEIDFITVAPRPLPTPSRVALSDVASLRTLTKQLRAHDAANGGGSCQGAILAQVHWANSLLHSNYTDTVGADLMSAVAELKTLAGWAAHDLGEQRATEATQLLAQALELTNSAGNPAQSAIVLYHLGRIPLDNGDPAEALNLFMLGQIAAQKSKLPYAVALLHANQALAHAQLGDAGEAISSLRRAEDEYAHGRPLDSSSPEYMKFFDAAALETAAARVHSALGLADPRHRDDAIVRLDRARAEAPRERRRQRAFNAAWLAACRLAAGDFDGAVQIGHEAVDEARELRSPRLVKHFDALYAQAALHNNRGDVADLSAEIRKLRGSAA